VTTDRDYGRRALPVPWFLASVVVWLVVVKLVGLATEDRADVTDGRLLTVGNLVWTLVVPLAAGCVVVFGLIAALGWWRPLLYEPMRVRRWVWVVPIVFAVAILAVINYGGLADRCVGVTSLRASRATRVLSSPSSCTWSAGSSSSSGGITSSPRPAPDRPDPGAGPGSQAV
jgi:hypothetical protein